MGITGLLPLLRPVTKNSHISAYKDRRVAVDGYAWLHKAVLGCCVELATGVETDRWIAYCLTLIDMLLSNGVEVHMVFDGANLPAKMITEVSRAAKRAASLEKGLSLLNSKNSADRTLGRNVLNGSVDVTPRMAAELIKVLRETRPKVMLFSVNSLLTARM